MAKPLARTTRGRAISCRPLRTGGSAIVGLEDRTRIAVDEAQRGAAARATTPTQQARSTFASYSQTGPTIFRSRRFQVSSFQHIGDRKAQEDRFVVAPHLDLDHTDARSCALFGIFDGTVGDFASENVKDLIIPKLLESPSWRVLHSGCGPRQGDSRGPAEEEQLLEQAVRDMYLGTEESLLSRCARSQQHYTTCTSVTLLVVGDLLAVAHLGDSWLVFGRESAATGELVGEQVTMDHKPDQEPERQRIERSGGLVVRLQNHGNKPFIRGGDFLVRKAMGEQPMQLQYSRAFGAKDLKVFGLSATPDVRLLRLGSSPYNRIRWAILGSDGLWDVLSSQQAVSAAAEAAHAGHNPAEALVRLALLEVAKQRGRADNITAVCVRFH